MKREWRFYVYIMASKSRVLYTGVAKSLVRRVWQHKNDVLEGFTKRYRIHRLVYFESFDDIRTAINREKQVKSWPRAKRVALIEALNPTWEDLAEHWYDAYCYSVEKQIPSGLPPQQAKIGLAGGPGQPARDDTPLGQGPK